MPQLSPMNWTLLPFLMNTYLYTSMIWSSFEKSNFVKSSVTNSFFQIKKLHWSW